jgi:hypothetical protein
MALRLTGLPARTRFPNVTISVGADVIVLVFSGSGGERTVEAPLRLAGAEADPESIVLRLCADLQAQGYRVSLAPIRP